MSSHELQKVQMDAWIEEKTEHNFHYLIKILEIAALFQAFEKRFPGEFQLFCKFLDFMVM